MPDKPGLGIELSPEALERFALRKGEAVPPGNYADMAFGREHYGVDKLEYSRS